MTGPKAVWFLDVDGVLNACPWLATRRGYPLPEPPWPDMVLGKAKSDPEQEVGYTITYSPTLMKQIRELHESGRVEVRWLTTWGAGANGELRELLGFPEFQLAGPHPTDDEMFNASAANVWWKRPIALGAIQDLGPDVNVIWTDDHLALAPSLITGLADAGILAIAPNETVGLTPRDMERILGYLDTGLVELAA